MLKYCNSSCSCFWRNFLGSHLAKIGNSSIFPDLIIIKIIPAPPNGFENFRLKLVGIKFIILNKTG